MAKQNLFQTLFGSRDGNPVQVKEAVATSRENVQQAANRFEETIRDMMKRNDRLTGRSHDAHSGHQPSRK